MAGGQLSGQEQDVDNFSFANQFTLLRLETRPSKPYSVNLRVTVIDGQLYVDAAPGRKWGKHLAVDPNVRIQLGRVVYAARALRVYDEDIVKNFLAGRHVYRMDPR
ncbi:MAG: hypothetical protein AAF525_17430 [Pseudomonadota bacterium]